jgi:hypothetical protein
VDPIAGLSLIFADISGADNINEAATDRVDRR